MSCPSDFPANWAVIEHLREECELSKVLQHTTSSTSYSSLPTTLTQPRSNSFPRTAPEEKEHLSTALGELRKKLRGHKRHPQLHKQCQGSNSNFQQLHMHRQTELVRHRQPGELAREGDEVRRRTYIGSGRSSESAGLDTDASESGLGASRLGVATARHPPGALDMNDPMTIAMWLV